MFLAINEMKEAKVRYSLIAFLLLLVAYLMFFLSGLSYGLIEENKSAIDLWKADTVLLSKEANGTLNFSNLRLDAKESIKADKVAALAQLNTVVWTKAHPKEKDKEKVSFFGIEAEQFLMPKIIKGRPFKEAREVLIDQSLADKNGFELGDSLKIANSDKEYKIVGISQKASFNVAPVIYTSLDSFQELRSNTSKPSKEKLVNAFIIRGNLDKYEDKDFQKLTMTSFINKLPGYSAQIATFAFMIGFLVLISAIIIGIFMYVLTIQKAPVFGIMKAQGISNKIISTAVLGQTLLLSLLGSTMGLLLTWLTSLLLPTNVPFLGNPFFYLVIFLSLIVFALLGTLFSVLVIIRIDPLKVIA
ncbi:ABC transporter permease [Streptococcus didelphis]|uniref:ABC transporter permease n=1 Tax=Streptococcus didelphis TaxID=102886 RepID=UPI000374107D|nr:ABC transporter permease [Streptococcus didelphis]